MKQLTLLDWVALVLVIIGGLNWGLVGILNFDLVATIFGVMSTISIVVYVLVALAAVYLAIVSPQLARK
jgi:uncharacterized membrane protein YuzA (DUF378 family)